jgi:hypothetical protein
MRRSRRDAPYLKRDAPYLKRDATYLKRNAPYLKETRRTGLETVMRRAENSLTSRGIGVRWAYEEGVG